LVSEIFCSTLDLYGPDISMKWVNSSFQCLSCVDLGKTVKSELNSQISKQIQVEIAPRMVVMEGSFDFQEIEFVWDR